MFSDVVLALEHMAGILPEMPLTAGLLYMFYTYTYKIYRVLDSKLEDYPRPRYMFRECTCVGVRVHVFFLGANFSRNVWLNNFTKSTTGY